MSGATLRRIACALGLALAASAGLARAAPQPGDDADTLFARAAGDLAAGRLEDAAVGFAEAARGYAAAGRAALEGEALLHEAEALHALGAHRAAHERLGRALRRVEEAGDPARSAAIRIVLGDVLVTLGKIAEAESELGRAQALARESGSVRLEASALNHLARARAAHGRLAEALVACQDAAARAAEAGDAELETQALANGARLALAADDPALAARSALAAASRGEALPDTRAKAFALTSAGRSLALAAEALPAERAALRLRAHAAFSAAAAGAEAQGDRRAASWALGELGALYEQDGRLDEALGLAARAAFAAQQAGADDPLWRWEEQRGRMLDRSGQPDAAIEAYRRAVAALQRLGTAALRGEDGRDASFRASIGQVHLGFADLLLRSSDGAPPERRQAALREARAVLELLKADELRDYFRDDCVDALRARIRDVERVSSSAVVVHHVLLADRLEALIALPSGVLERSVTPVGAEDVGREVQALRERLVKRTTRQYLPHAQTLYRWLVAPLEPALADAEVVVFVPDGALRTIPFAALHDGERFLIEKHAVATTPGIELTDPRPLRGPLSPLLVGLSESRAGMPPLPFVDQEIRSIHARLGGSMLLDEAFRMDGIREALSAQSIKVLHVASHAEFTGAGEQAGVLAWDGRITMDQLRRDVGLYRYREQPLELLTLSACETAAGDERAALGLSGIAVKAGARSALGTLWKVNDEAASRLVVDFYDQLGQGASRAQALRHAQRGLLAEPRFQHPGYWSPFLLIGNWL